MRLLIISNMPHYIRRDGVTVGWGPTVQELDHLATRFDEVRHIATLHGGEAPASFLPYRHDHVELVGVTPRGGDRFIDKLEFLAAVPGYASVMLRELARADVVHLRCPANLPMLAASLLPFVHVPAARWIKYGGNWRPAKRDSIAFTFQRWLLAHPWHRGVVTVNGSWPEQPAHVRSFYNPSLFDEELRAARERVANKRLDSPLRLLFVGSLLPGKRCAIAIQTVAALRDAGIAATMDVVGDGPDRARCEATRRELGLEDAVALRGWVPRTHLGDYYAGAHFVLVPSQTEGWPKVLSEGMAYGVLPIAAPVGAISQYLTEFRCGRVLESLDAAAIARTIAAYDSDTWLVESRRGLEAARHFSYPHYLREVDALLEELSRASGFRARTI